MKAFPFFFQMLMSAMMVAITVTRIPPVKTPLDTSNAVARRDTEEMDATVKVEIRLSSLSHCALIFSFTGREKINFSNCKKMVS